MANRSGDIKLSDGVPSADLRVGQQGDLSISQLHSTHYEQSVRRNLFFSTSIARATSLVTAIMVGHTIWNPPDSGINVVLSQITSSVSVTSASTTGFTLAVGYQSTLPTGVVVTDAAGSTLLTMSGATNQVFRAGKAKAYSTATFLLAPISFWYLHHNTAAIATTGVDLVTTDIDGQFIVPPGGFVSIAALGAAAAAAGHNSSITWEEVPIVGLS